MDFPKEGIVFGEVQYDKSYSTSIRITNPFAVPVDILLATSSNRLSIKPAKLHLGSSESATLEVSFSIRSSQIISPVHKTLLENIRLKSAYFDQAIPVKISIGDSKKKAPSTGLVSQSDQSSIDAIPHSSFEDSFNFVNNQLQLERQRFEDSSFKVLGILKQKDEKISHLEKLLDTEVANHSQTKVQLLNIQSKLNEKSGLTEMKDEMNSNIRILMQENASLASELQNLRDRCADQNEQINVLVYELSKWREEEKLPPTQSSAMAAAQEEIRRLRKELDNSQSKEEERLNQIDRVEAANLAADRRKAEVSNHLNDTVSSEALYENAVEGGVHTSTPVDFSGPNVKPIVDHDHPSSLEMNIMAQQRIRQLESEVSQLQTLLADSQAAEAETTERLNECERAVVDLTRECESFHMHNERLQAELKDVEAEAMKSSRASAAAKPSSEPPNISSNESKAAHTWWQYVWHECSRLGVERSMTLQTLHHGNDPTSEATKESEIQYHGRNVLNNLRTQAIEIATLKQEALGQQLRYRQEVESLKSETEELREECARLRNKMRLHQSDKETKIAELAATIKGLSMKSALHSQLAAARQEAEAEKLVSSHLRFELEEYRNFLEQEQRKQQALRRENVSLQGIVDSVSVLRTVLSTSGDGLGHTLESGGGLIGNVNPAELIEVMSGEFVRLKSTVVSKDKELVDCNLNRQSLQKIVNKYKEEFKRSKLLQEENTKNKLPSKGAKAARGDNLLTSKRLDNKIDNDFYEAGSKAIVQKAESESRNIEIFETVESDSESLNSITETRSESKPPARKLKYQPLHIKLDHETNPKTVLDCLEAAMLRDKVVSQDILIAELQRQLDGKDESTRLMVKDMPEVAVILKENESELANLKENLLMSSRHQTLLAIQLEEIKQESQDCKLQLHLLKEENFKLKSVKMRVSSGFPNNAEKPESPDDDDDESAGSKDDNQNSRRLLRERTAQLQTVMETLDSLHSAGIVFPSNANSAAGLSLGGGHHQEHHQSQEHRQDESQDLFNLAFQPFQASSGATSRVQYQPTSLFSDKSSSPTTSATLSWGISCMVKRIVQLTAELCSSTSSLSLEQQRNKELEMERKRRTKSMNILKTQIKQADQKILQLQFRVNSLLDESEDLQINSMKRVSTLETDNNNLLTALRDLQSKLDIQQLNLQQSQDALNSTDQAAVNQWLSNIVNNTSDELEPLEPKFENFEENPKHSSPIEGDILQLLSQWRQSTPLTTQTNKETNEQFNQRVVDMVLKCSEVATQAVIKQHEMESKLRSCVVNRLTNEKIVKMLAKKLIHMRRRSIMSEKALMDSLSISRLQNQSTLETMLKKALQKAREERDALAVSFRQSKKIHRNGPELGEEGKYNSSIIDSHIRLLQQQFRIAEQESRGSIFLQAREEAVAAVEEKLKALEQSFYDWFRVELPRLVAGLPITEDSLAAAESYSKFNFSDKYAVDSKDDLAAKFGSSVGLDKTFALSQALCSSKATQSMHEIKIHNLQERISVLKEKNIELEGVIIRWKDEVSLSEMLSQNLQRRSNHQSNRYDEQNMKQLIDSEKYEDSPSSNKDVKLESDEKSMQENIHLLSDKVSSLEEINVQLKDRYEQSAAQCNNLREMLDTILNEEGRLKIHSTRQMTQLRTDLEIAHSEEMRRLRRVYEQERQLLLGELKDIGNAVEDAHLLTAADEITGRASEIEGAVTKSKVFNDSIQRHIEAIEKEFSLSQSESVTTNQKSESEDSQWAVRGVSIRRLNKVDKQTETIDTRKYFSVSSQTDDYENVIMREVRNERNGNVFALRSETNSNSSTPSQSIRDVYFDNLERSLAIERRKSEEARNEVKELELMLSIQKAAFDQHLDDHSSAVASSAALKHASAQVDERIGDHSNRKRDASIQTLRVAPGFLPPHPTDMLYSLEREFGKERQELWPSEVELLSEIFHLVKLSHSCINLGRSQQAQITLQNAMAMVSRLREIFMASHRNRFNSFNESEVMGKYNFSYLQEDVEDSSSFTSDIRNINERLESMVIEYQNLSVVANEKITRNNDMKVNVDRDPIHKLQQRIEHLEEALQKSRQSEELKESERKHSIETIQNTYKRALDDANAALDATTAAAKDEIHRMEGLIDQLKSHIHELESQLRESINRMEVRDADAQVELADDNSSRTSKSPNSSLDSDVDVDAQQHKQRYVVTANEMDRLRQELDKMKEELEQSKELLQRTEQIHSIELSNLKNHFNQFKNIQDEVVTALENQILEETASNSRMRNRSNDAFDSSEQLFPLLSLQDAEEKIHKMSAQFQAKKTELDAVMRSFSKFKDDSSIQSRRIIAPEESSAGSSLEYPSISALPLYPPRYQSPTFHESRSRQSSTPTRKSRRRSRSADSIKNQSKVDSTPIRKSETTAAINSLSMSAKADETASKNQLDYAETRQEILSARVTAAEKKIDTLQRTLSQERSENSHLKLVAKQLRSESSQQKLILDRQRKTIEDRDRQLTASWNSAILRGDANISAFSEAQYEEVERALVDAARFLQALEAEYNPGLDHPDKLSSRQLTDRLIRVCEAANEMRLHAMRHVHELRELLILYLSAYSSSHNIDQRNHEQSRREHFNQPPPSTETTSTLKTNPHPDSAVGLKEDLVRKSKLLAALKVARNADLNSLEQWKSEYKKMEENYKRLQRSLEAKENLLKDLKAKVAASAEQKEKDLKESGDVSTLSAAELRTRLKASELERARGRTRLQALKDKIAELESNLAAQAAENERLKRTAGSVTELRMGLTRKDEVIAALRAQLERSQAEVQQLRFLDDTQQAEGQKKVRQLQRQLEQVRRSHEELEKEASLMRGRLLNAQQQWVRVDHSNNINQNTSKLGRNHVDSGVGQPVQRVSLSGLDHEATQDIHDVLASLQWDLNPVLTSTSKRNGLDLWDAERVSNSLEEEEENELDEERNRAEGGEGTEEEDEELSVEKRLNALVSGALRRRSVDM